MKWTGRGLALLAAMALGATPATAATTFTVTGTADAAGATCTGTVCTSLRAAVANVPAGGTIELGTGIYKLNGVLAIAQSETIVGVSPARTTIQQTKTGDGVIEASAGDLSLSDLTITGGTKVGHNGFDQHAGGIFTAGTSLSLDHVSVTNNTATGSIATGANGGDAVGAIQIDGASTALTISNSSITNNAATGGTGADIVGSGNGKAGGVAYGALADFAAAPTITNTVIAGNVATGGNGGTGSGNPGFHGGLSGQADGAITIIAKPTSSTTLITGSTIANNKSIGGRGGKGTNTAGGGNGNTVFGAIAGVGNTLKVTSSTISGNTAQPSAGGAGSTPSNNGSDGTVMGSGFGIDSGSLILINSTVAGNVITGQSGEGAGIDMRGDGLTLANATVFGNSAPQGGNLNVSSSQLTLAGTLIAGGVQTVSGGPSSSNCNLDTVTETDIGHNLESTTPSQCGLSAGKQDLIGANPQLASLAANGGPTQTMAPGGTSPALTAGGSCTDISQPGTVPLTVDQRGLPRATPCDIGAVQHQLVAQQSAPSITGTPTFGKTLTCSPGTWSGDGLSYGYLWLRGGRPIASQTRSTHVVAAADFATTLACAVTVTGTYSRASAQASLTMPANCNCTPKISRFAQSHRAWRRSSSPARLSVVARRPPVGTTFTFTLDRAATVTLSFTRSSAGRVVGGRCIAVTAGNRHGRSCTRATPAGTLSLKAHRGNDKITFAGHLSRRKRLGTGNYLVGITAALPGGPSSRPSTLRFSVVG